MSGFWGLRKKDGLLFFLDTSNKEEKQLFVVSFVVVLKVNKFGDFNNYAFAQNLSVVKAKIKLRLGLLAIN